MRIVIIGGSGHIGSFLTPALVNAGHHVICVSRQVHQPYLSDPAWNSVQWAVMDREKREAAGSFGDSILQLRPDIVIDLICFTVHSAKALVDNLQGSIKHFLHCGTMWVHGKTGSRPAEESDIRRPFGDYGIQKAAIESFLLDRAAHQGFPVSIIHPGHIVGPGWRPVNPAGNLDPEVFRKLAEGTRLALPGHGAETLHHVHASDVAQGFLLAIEQPEKSFGESFQVVSPAPMTMRDYAELMANWFGREPQLEFLPWEQWKQTVSEEDAAITLDHMEHSANGSIAKAHRLLGYQPGYTSIKAIQESVDWLIRNNQW